MTLRNPVIAVISPSSRGGVDEAGIAALEARGFTVRLHPQNALEHGSSAGTAAARAHALMEVFVNPDVDIVMAARGGNRAMHMLPLLDYALLRAHPKPFVGFSDSTAVLNALYAKSGLKGIHGPTLSHIARQSPDAIDLLAAAMRGEPVRVPLTGARILQGGRARGPALGGNLSMFSALAGTPYFPDTRGAVLFLEDTGDQLSRFDRMFAQLRLAGVLEEAAGIVVGAIDAQPDSGPTPFQFSLDDILAEACEGLSCPIVTGAPFGHGGPFAPFVFGGDATLDAPALFLAFEPTRQQPL